MQRLSEPQRMELKDVTRRAIDLAGGSTRFAPVARVKKAQLSKYCSLSEKDAFIRADIILEHFYETGSPMLLEHLARLAGFKLVLLGDEDLREPVGISDLLDVSRQTGDVQQALGAALEDGVVDMHERREVRKQIAEAKSSLSRLDRKLARA